MPDTCPHQNLYVFTSAVQKAQFRGLDCCGKQTSPRRSLWPSGPICRAAISWCPVSSFALSPSFFFIRFCVDFARFPCSSLESLVVPRVYGEPCKSAGVESAISPFKGSDACVSRNSLDVCCLTCSTVACVPSNVMFHCANLDGVSVVTALIFYFEKSLASTILQSHE